MTAVKAMFLGKVYGWYREVHNLKHDIMEHMETETSEGNIPFQFLAKKIRPKEERELDHDTCYLAKEKVEENGMKKGLGLGGDVPAPLVRTFSGSSGSVSTFVPPSPILAPVHVFGQDHGLILLCEVHQTRAQGNRGQE